MKDHRKYSEMQSEIFDLFVSVLFEPVESSISFASVLSGHSKSKNALLVFERIWLTRETRPSYFMSLGVILIYEDATFIWLSCLKREARWRIQDALFI